MIKRGIRVRITRYVPPARAAQRLTGRRASRPRSGGGEVKIGTVAEWLKAVVCKTIAVTHPRFKS